MFVWSKSMLTPKPVEKLPKYAMSFQVGKDYWRLNFFIKYQSDRERK